MPDPLWERLLVAATAPAVTALLALVVVNQVASVIQGRREAGEIREILTAEMTETANSLYFILQRFWRAARDVPLNQRLSSPDLAEERERLNDAYQSARIKSQVIERKLLIYYADQAPARAWHRVFDLLSTRYFLLLESDGKRRRAIRNRNAGEDHSGLSPEQLNNPSLLVKTIRSALAEAIETLWHYKVDRRARHQQNGQPRSTWH
jgi:hypothetical protein